MVNSICVGLFTVLAIKYITPDRPSTEKVRQTTHSADGIQPSTIVIRAIWSPAGCCPFADTQTGGQSKSKSLLTPTHCRFPIPGGCNHRRSKILTNVDSVFCCGAVPGLHRVPSRREHNMLCPTGDSIQYIVVLQTVKRGRLQKNRSRQQLFTRDTQSPIDDGSSRLLASGHQRDSVRGWMRVSTFSRPCLIY